MKKILKSILFIAATAAILAFASCSNDDDENNDKSPSVDINQQPDSSTQTGGQSTQTDGTDQTGTTPSTSVTLPASVGENPFTGKTYTALGKKWEFTDTSVKFTEYDVNTSTITGGASSSSQTANNANSTSSSSGSAASSSGTAITNPIFYNQEAQVVVEVNENRYWTYEYDYTYDATNQILYLLTKSYGTSSTNSKITNATEYVESYKSSIKNWTTDTESYYTEYCNLKFSEIKAKKYEFSGDTLKMTNYFTGDILLSQETGNGPQIYIKGGLRLNDIEGNSWTSSSSGISLYAFPKFKDGQFSGNAYKSSDNGGYEKVGIVRGSYTTSEPGIGSWHAKLNFTTLPAGLTYIQTGVEYTLSSSGNSSYDTYTLVN